MKRFLFLVMLAAVEVGHAEFVTDLSKGWRFSVGPQFNFNASGRLGVKGGAIPLPAASFSSTRGAAKAAGDRISEGSWPLTLPNGAFVNPHNSTLQYRSVPADGCRRVSQTALPRTQVQQSMMHTGTVMSFRFCP